MKKNTIEMLRNMTATSIDEPEREKEKIKFEMRWSSVPVPGAEERLAALDVVEVRQRELERAAEHAMVFRQWAAHRACENARGYAACVHAACRLMAAYDREGTTEASTFAASVVRRTVKDGVPTPSLTISDQLAKSAEWHGHFRVAKIISSGEYTREDEIYDEIGDRLQAIFRKRNKSWSRK